MGSERPRLLVAKLASCDGCQLALLNCEDELLAINASVQLVSFAEATSVPDDGGPVAIALLEGSVSTEEQLHALKALRARAKTLIAIGACATAGGIQSLRNFYDMEEFRRAVYAQPAYVSSLATATPPSAHVKIDYELRGCPIDKGQLLEVLTAALVGRKPQLPNEPVCMECKRAGAVCVTVARGEACLGPVTQAGCGALCPRFARGCYGCFGPRADGNIEGLSARLQTMGLLPAEALVRKYRGFTAWAPVFRDEGKRLQDAVRKEKP